MVWKHPAKKKKKKKKKRESYGSEKKENSLRVEKKRPFQKNKTSTSPKEQTSYIISTLTLFFFLFWIGKVTLHITDFHAKVRPWHIFTKSQMKF